MVTHLSLILTMFCWGGTFIAGRSLAGAVSPASAAFFRFTFATLALALLARLIDGKLPPPPLKQLPSLMFLGATGVLSYNLLFFYGLQHIEAGRAALIIALNPLAISLFSAMFLRETLSLRQYAGIVISLLGAFVVITNGHLNQIFSGDFGRGELAILGCVLSWTAYSIVGRHVLKSLTPLCSVFYSSLFGTFLLSGPAFWGGSLSQSLNYSGLNWLSLLFLGIFGTAVGFSLYYMAIRRIGPTRAGVFINLVPFFAIILSWLLLGETIKPIVFLGGILLLFGVTITNIPATSKIADHKRWSSSS